MRKLILLSVALSLVFIFTSCKKEDCGADLNPVCNETVPVDEECLAFFNRWFFDNSSNSCEQKAYSGCSQKGFATKEECETCQCND